MHVKLTIDKYNEMRDKIKAYESAFDVFVPSTDDTELWCRIEAAPFKEKIMELRKQHPQHDDFSKHNIRDLSGIFVLGKRD